MTSDVSDFNIDIEEEEEPIVSADELEEFVGLIETIQGRCDAAEIRWEEDEGGELGVNYDLFFPEGRGERLVTIWDIEDAETLLSIKFENIRFIEGYHSYCSYNTGVINAGIIPLVPIETGVFGIRNRPKKIMELLKLISSNPDGDGIEEIRINIPHPSNPDQKTIIITLPSGLDRLFSKYAHAGRLSMRIRGLNLSTHDEAKRILETIADSVFLQIEAETGVPLSLARSSTLVIGHRDEIKKLTTPPTYAFPSIEYNREPMIYYWYGVSAYQMPLMQFLAFYQAIEYFYPLYSEFEAKRAVQGILKSPNFRVDRNSDIARLFQAFKSPGARSC